jgi:hypothetical protein
MDDYMVKKAQPVPPVTKAGLKEFLLELIVDADLVSFLSHEYGIFPYL